MSGFTALEIHDLGLCDYGEIWALQKERVLLRARQEIPNQLLLVEHPPVLTCGRRFLPQNLRLQPPEQIPVYTVERGGDISFHEPGQLVGYPIVWLPPEKRDVMAFLKLLEQTLIRTLADVGAPARSHPEAGHTGVWLGERKVASIGISLRRWVVWHGFALNVNNELGLLPYLNPCGFSPEVMISLKEWGQSEYNMKYIKERVSAHFQELLSLA
ncbi:MAG: lipoyl(octanoyl) transferase LipB [Candidatus Sericytochromatia bacterium]